MRPTTTFARRCALHSRQTPSLKSNGLDRPSALYASSQLANRTFASSTFSRTIPETHYDFFPETIPQGPPPRGPFRIDLKQLRAEFLRAQASAHPDRHAAGRKARAEALSARINEAYKALQSPLSRAQYILALRGIDVAEDETAKVDDQALLLEVLEIREEIEDAQEEDDLKGLRMRNDERIAESVVSLERAFEDDDLERAQVEAVKLRYWTNIKESVDNWVKGEPVVLVH